MHVDLSLKIRDLNNKVLEEVVHGSQEPITLGKVLVGALLNSPDQFGPMSGADKEARFRLAVRLSSTDASTELTDKEVDLLKDVVGKSFGTLVVGRVYDILNRKSPS